MLERNVKVESFLNSMVAKLEVRGLSADQVIRLLKSDSRIKPASFYDSVDFRNGKIGIKVESNIVKEVVVLFERPHSLTTEIHRELTRTINLVKKIILDS